jgi:hypothetical protein
MKSGGRTGNVWRTIGTTSQGARGGVGKYEASTLLSNRPVSSKTLVVVTMSRRPALTRLELLVAKPLFVFPTSEIDDCTASGNISGGA